MNKVTKTSAHCRVKASTTPVLDMIKNRTLNRLAAVASLGLAAFCASAQASTYNLYQDGFAGGGSVSGYFTGSDLDGDGMVIGVAGMADEITDFHLAYSGGTLVGAFTVDYADFLQSLMSGGGMIYQLGSHTIGTDPGSLTDGAILVIDFDASLTGQYAILVGPFMTGSAGYVGNPNGVGDVTLAPMTVPEPSSLALATLASLGLLGVRRKR